MRHSLNDLRTRRALITLTAFVALTTGTGSYAGPTPEQQCQAGKNKTAGKYAACRENAEAKLATSGDTTKYGEAITKCAAKFATAWQKLEDKAVKAGTVCPSVGDATGVDGRITATTDTIAARAGGIRFEDNGDGTVTDHQTGLQWEKKVSPGGGATDPHDVDNSYTWNTVFSGTTPNGTAFTDFLGKLNFHTAGGSGFQFACFAFHCDWRLPTLEELLTIRLETPCGMGACIDPIFGPTAADVSDVYWTATTVNGGPEAAWIVDFTGGSGLDNKGASDKVRAVRGGL
jgi:hypothetical protein